MKSVWQSLRVAAGIVAACFLTWQIILPWTVVGAVVWGISSLIAGFPINPLCWFFGALGLTYFIIFCVLLRIQARSHHHRI